MMTNFETIVEIEGGVTVPAGFQAAGLHCGIKKGKKDIAIVYSERPAVVGGVFTLNRVPAAPVLLDKEQLSRSDEFRAIVVNSGNANACTGERGMMDARVMARTAAQALGIDEREVLVSSTGVIGQFLPMDAVQKGIAEAARQLSREGGTSAAEAIRTTDTFTKEIAVQTQIGGVPVTVGGMAKGSGMIAPNMATMLAFVTTDAQLSAGALRHAVRESTERSFNRITVDGDTSTNDMVLVLANGNARNTPITAPGNEDYLAFCRALEHVLVRLSKMIVKDGEGATKFVEIRVTEALSEQTAVRAARAIANSNLVKTAINGEDANWGRILAAVGNSGIEFDPASVEIAFGDLPILRRNYCIDFSEEKAKEILSRDEIVVTVSLHQGNASACFWTCDLSSEYVAINANYRT
jgi:glutamate N-acetyltransferase/amino-acid N-acetyltransferase